MIVALLYILLLQYTPDNKAAILSEEIAVPDVYRETSKKRKIPKTY